jgi:hypothetical protein
LLYDVDGCHGTTLTTHSAIRAGCTIENGALIWPGAGVPANAGAEAVIVAMLRGAICVDPEPD